MSAEIVNVSYTLKSAGSGMIWSQQLHKHFEAVGGRELIFIVADGSFCACMFVEG